MRSASLSLALLLSFSLDSATAHMSPFLGSMYGVGKNWDYPAGSLFPRVPIKKHLPDYSSLAGDPVSPIGPGVGSRDAWWFRGPAARALPPTGRNNSLALLPAGGSFEVDITCHVAWSGVGWRTTPYDSPLDACPENPGQKLYFQKSNELLTARLLNELLTARLLLQERITPTVPSVLRIPTSTALSSPDAHSRSPTLTTSAKPIWRTWVSVLLIQL